MNAAARPGEMKRRQIRATLQPALTRTHNPKATYLNELALAGDAQWFADPVGGIFSVYWGVNIALSSFLQPALTRIPNP